MIDNIVVEQLEDMKQEIDRLNNIDSIMYNVLNELINENDELKKIQCTFLGTGCKKQLEDMKQEIDKLNNIINELEKYIHDELILDYYNDDMPCELIINKMEKRIKGLKDR